MTNIPVEGNNNKNISFSDDLKYQKEKMDFTNNIKLIYKIFNQAIISRTSNIEYNEENRKVEDSIPTNNKLINIEEIKKMFKKLIQEFHEINNLRIKELKIPVEKKYNGNNNSNTLDCKEKCHQYLNINQLYELNIESVSRRNKFIDYIQNKENYYSQLNEERKKIFNFSDKFTATEENLFVNKRICCVCNNGDIEQNQFILKCEQCSVTVHQNCYGVQTKDLNNWKCDACKEMVLNEVNNLECLLCPVKGGAFKKVELPKDSNFYKSVFDFKNKGVDLPKANYNIIIPQKDYSEINCAWAHLSCSLWNPNINIGNFESKTKIHLEHISFDEFKNYCSICQKSNSGPTIKCNNENCNMTFHPECARINNCCLEVEIINKEYQYNIYCYKHKPNLLAKKINNSHENDIQQIITFNNELNKLYELHKKIYKYDLFQKQKVINHIEISKDKTKYFTKKKRGPYSINSYSIYHTKKYFYYKKKLKPKNTPSINSNIKIFKQKNHKKYNSINNIIIDTKNIIISLPTIEINNSLYKNENINIINYPTIEEEIKNNKDSFITYLIGYLNDYTLQNRVIIKTNPSTKRKSLDKKAPVYFIKYNEFVNNIIPWEKIGYKNLSTSMLKKYFFSIFPNENKFIELFSNQIETILSKLKLNKQYEYISIQCDNKENCIGSSRGIYKLLSINDFKYQILSESKTIFSQKFLCSSCVNNEPNIEIIQLKKK